MKRLKLLGVVTSCGLAAVAMSHAATVSGDVIEVASNVQHPNGNVYDQLMLKGSSGAVVAGDPGQVVRVSFIDLNDDIVQVEFTGKGSLAITLDGATGPAVAAKYNQPGVLYMRGHARLEVSGSDATTNVSIFAVGAQVGVNPAIFKPGEKYDGFADLAEIKIVADATNPNGSAFGGLRAGNAMFWARSGRTGIYAPKVHLQLARIADMTAYDAASPALVLGSLPESANLEVSTGQLRQANGRLIEVSYSIVVAFAAGGVVYFAPPSPGSQSTQWHLIGHDGTPLLWVVPPSTL